MGRNAAAKLTSEERCRKAFDRWYTGAIRDWYAIAFPEIESDLIDAAAWVAWTACWKDLESRVEEFVKS